MRIQADQLLNLVYDRKNDRILGVDQGIDRDKYRNYHLKETYTRRSSGHRLFALNAQDGKLLASIETKDVPISLLLDEDSERITSPIAVAFEWRKAWARFPSLRVKHWLICKPSRCFHTQTVWHWIAKRTRCLSP